MLSLLTIGLGLIRISELDLILKKKKTNFKGTVF